MHRMERRLAYEHCVAVLNAYVLHGVSREFRLSEICLDDEAARAILEEAVRYLQWRGLLACAAGTSDLCELLDEDESEAAA